MNRDGENTKFDEGFGRRRVHAEIEGMMNLMLDHIATLTEVCCPPRVRTFLSALQSAHGGGKFARGTFERAHLTVAQYLQFKGSDVAKEARVRRLLAEVEEYQRRCGFVLVRITRGGGEEQRKTSYVDYLVPAADEAVTRARASELWKGNNAKGIKPNPPAAKAEQVKWAVEQLPRITPAPDSKKDEMKLSDYANTQSGRIEGSARKVAEKIEEKGGKGSVWLRTLAKQLLKDASEMELQRGAADAGTVTKLLPSDDEATVTEVLPSAADNSSIPEEKPDVFTAARALSAKGFRTFPLHWIKADGACSCPRGAGCESPGKHPRISEWQKLASTDESFHKAWFKKQWPGANVGILTGESGLCVIDFDFDKGGEATLAEWRAQHGDGWLDTLAVRTGGGLHLYFQLPQGLDLRNTAGKIGAGVDSRANGGFVVAPPSLHASGRRYEWLNELEPAPLPDFLIKSLTQEKTAAAAPPDTKASPQAKSGAGVGLVITEPGRNNALFKIGCSLRGKGAELPEIEAELLDINARRCSPPLPESEVLKTARSAASYAANRVAVGV